MVREIGFTDFNQIENMMKDKLNKILTNNKDSLDEIVENVESISLEDLRASATAARNSVQEIENSIQEIESSFIDDPTQEIETNFIDDPTQVVPGTNYPYRELVGFDKLLQTWEGEYNNNLVQLLKLN